MRVLLTRQPAQASRLEAGLTGARVRGHGAKDAVGEPVELALLPLTDFALPADDGPLRRLVAELAPSPSGAGSPVATQAPARWLLVTSPNTVRALARRGWDGALPDDVRVAATGPGTARALHENGCVTPVWTPSQDRSARGIAAGLREAVPEGARAWLPQSDRARPDLADRLREGGWSVRTVPAYRTVPYPAPAAVRLLAAAPERTDVPVWTPQDLAEAGAGTVVVVTSSSAAEQFVRRCLPRGGGPAPARLIAIGDPTAATLRDLGIPADAVCATPDAAGVLDALAGLARAG